MDGSGWRFRSIVSLNVFTAEYKPLKGSSYIPLPSCLASKKAIINMQNEDEECFKWSITRALNSKEIPTLEELRQLAKERGFKRYSELNKAKLLEQLEIKVVLNPQRIDKKLQEQAKELNWNGINFPASWKDIDKFEKNNPTISVNVYGYDNGIGVYPLRISDYIKQRETHVNLLLISNGERQHYCWIKNMSSLLYGQTSQHHGERRYCLRCLNGVASAKSLAIHEAYCEKHPIARRVLPEPEKAILQFNHLNYSMRVPYIVKDLANPGWVYL